jgi:hypothetical protein
MYRCHYCLHLKRSSDRKDEILTVHVGAEQARFCPDCVAACGVVELTKLFFNELTMEGN